MKSAIVSNEVPVSSWKRVARYIPKLWTKAKLVEGFKYRPREQIAGNNRLVVLLLANDGSCSYLHVNQLNDFSIVLYGKGGRENAVPLCSMILAYSNIEPKSVEYIGCNHRTPTIRENGFNHYVLVSCDTIPVTLEGLSIVGLEKLIDMGGVVHLGSTSSQFKKDLLAISQWLKAQRD